jgi:hypothetical protein
MHQGQFALSGCIGRLQRELRHLIDQPLAQKLVFAHGEPVAVRQGLHMGGSVKKLHLPRIVRENAPKARKDWICARSKGFRKNRFFVALQQKTLDLTSIDPILLPMLRRNKNKTQ